MPIIKIENFTKVYSLPDNKNDTFCAVDGVSLLIETGEIFGILGPNGAGKTTTLRCIGSLVAPDEGTVRIDSIDVAQQAHEARQARRARQAR